MADLLKQIFISCAQVEDSANLMSGKGLTGWVVHRKTSGLDLVKLLYLKSVPHAGDFDVFPDLNVSYNHLSLAMIKKTKSVSYAYYW